MTKRAKDGCKGNGDSDVRVAGSKDGKGSKVMAMVMAKSMAGKWSATAMKKLMAKVRRVAGKQQ